MADPVPLFPPPQDPDPIMVVEQALLGSLMMNARKAVPLLPASFSSTHYLDPLHRDIHDAVVALDCGAPEILTQAMTVAGEDRHYVTQMISAAVSWHAVPNYAEAVTEAFHRRLLAEIAETVLASTKEGSKDAPASSIAMQAVASIDAMLAGCHTVSPGRSLDAAMDATLEQATRAAHGEMILGRSTGMPLIDDVLGGLENACFYVLAARPGMGKTGLGVQWAVNVARACKAATDAGEPKSGVAMFSLEMSSVALARRVIAEAAKVSVVDLKRGRIEGRVPNLTRARHQLGGLPLWIEDAGGQNLVAIRQKCRAMQRKWGRLALVVVDHIHIVKPDDADRRNGATQAIGKISNALRDLSKEFDCPVLALAQLSRGLLSRDDKRPNLGDLRQAGDIEQDADAVMFVHREEALLPKTAPEQTATESEAKWETRVKAWETQRERSRGKAELIFEKVRDGEPKIVHLLFDGPTTSFSEPVRSGAVPTAQGNLGDFHDKFDEPEGLWP